MGKKHLAVAVVGARANAPLLKRQTRARQRVFLAVYAELGTIRAACRQSKIPRRTVREWRDRDLGGFKAQMLEAEHAWRESLEDLARSRVENPQGNRGSDVLLMGMLNANHPDKWRGGKVDSPEVAREVVSELRQLAQQQARAVAHDPDPDPKPIESPPD